MAKIRADARLVELRLAESRSKAQALILAGKVYLDETRIDKPGSQLAVEAELRLIEAARFVSRGGYKLEGALEALGLSVEGDTCADIGAATGGFTDCLLQRGAGRIYAVDVGHNLLHERLARDPRVQNLERTNARQLTPERIGEPLDGAVVDASFIGIGKLMPALSQLLPVGAWLLVMIKPQFEAGREAMRKTKGVIRDPELRQRAIDKATADILDAGFTLEASCDSALAGPKGNLEHFVLVRRV